MTPEQAREICANFRIEGRGKVDFIELDGGRVINLGRMSDEEALLVAELILDLQGSIEKRKGNQQ